MRETAELTSGRKIGASESARNPSDAPTVAPPSTAATLAPAGEFGPHTLVADGDAPVPAGPRAVSRTSGTITVLPDVVPEGDQLTLVARDKTRYEHERTLGRGGMGEVGLAQDHDIGRRVAVKRMLDDRPHSVARFVDEIRTVGALEHPNIVPIHDVGIDDQGRLFFVMKYVEGETLADVIRRLASGDREAHTAYPLEHRMDIFASILRALHYAHERGLVHRDIKPENVMIGRYGEVVLMDWGIAHRMRTDDRITEAAQTLLGDRATAETVDGAVVGTCQYMSPEQAAGDVADLDGRSDLYSAYVLFYELLTLQPYIEEAPSATATIIRVQERERPRWNDPAWFNPHQPTIPTELRHFMWRGLAHDRAERPPSAQAVLDELERLRAGDIRAECMVTTIKASRSRFERLLDTYPAVFGALVLLTPIFVIGGAVGWVMWATQ